MTLSLQILRSIRANDRIGADCRSTESNTHRVCLKTRDPPQSTTLIKSKTFLQCINCYP